mmetsp:Transcript_48044/g.57936  ORF Transcript_48044/g.57936 Transcript_48044/m.57936 type:complete len:89 (-) Transcript_48044:1926-2192(-)
MFGKKKLADTSPPKVPSGAVFEQAEKEARKNKLDASTHPEFALYGKHVFTGQVADDYLKQHGSSGAILKEHSWVKNHADVVASAMLEW